MLPLLPGAPSDAQTSPVSGAPASVSLSAIDLAVGPGAGDAASTAAADSINWTLLVENASQTPWTRIEVVTEVHGPLGSRSALRAALAGGAAPPVVARTVIPGTDGPLVPGGIMRIVGALPLTGAALTGPTNAVHPLRLQVLADGEIVGRIDTAIVRLGTAPVETLSTSLVWPISAPPSRDPSGDVSALLDPVTVSGGRLDTLTTAASAAPAGADGDAGWAGLAIVPALHLLEDLALRSIDVPADGSAVIDDGTDVDEAAVRAAELLRRIRSVALTSTEGPVVTPYADVDLAQLLASGPALQPLASRAALEGARRVTAAVGRPQAPVVLLDGRVVPAALDLLSSSTVLLPYAAVDAPDLALDVPVGEPVRTLRSQTGRTLTAVIGDPYLSAALGASTRATPGDPVLAAHEVLVRTAMVHLEAPGRPGRSVLLLPPGGFDPDPRFAAALIAGLHRAPWLTPRGPTALVAAADGEREPIGLAEPPITPLPGRLVDALRRTERDLQLLVGATAGVPTELDVAIGTRDLRSATDELMRAVSRTSPGGTDGALALLEGVSADVATAFGAFGIAATDVTLTDRDGIVPLTILRTGGVTMRVRIEVTGPAALGWPDGRVREVVLAADTTGSLELPVRSGSTGRFPVTVRITDPSGERVLATETLSVRATALAGPALALISLLVVGLVAIGTVRQRRRGPSVALDRTGG